MMMPHGASPIGNMGSPDWAAKILHASLEIGDTMLFASDAPPNRYSKPGGFSVSWTSRVPRRQNASSVSSQRTA